MSSSAWPTSGFVAVAADGRGFVCDGHPFAPWGFNYDHDDSSPPRLLEEYWEEDWARVERDFRAMARLGATVIRVHLQVAAFMADARTPHPAALDRLARLLDLAGTCGLCLDITGLGAYRPAAQPAWFVQCSERDRWEVQARFWAAIAGRVAGSPQVFCYDLMNEPLVPNTAVDSWTPGGVFGFDFCQYLTQDPTGRERTAVVTSWIRQLREAVREHDPDHLITIGLHPLTGVAPGAIAAEVDFICVHEYPVAEQLEASVERVLPFTRCGKPVVVEETFPLRCSAAELLAFITRMRDEVAGWISFYWGDQRPPAEWVQAFARAVARPPVEGFTAGRAPLPRTE